MKIEGYCLFRAESNGSEIDSHMFRNVTTVYFSFAQAATKIKIIKNRLDIVIFTRWPRFLSCFFFPTEACID
jgi:hypothetical protein